MFYEQIREIDQHTRFRFDALIRSLNMHLSLESRGQNFVTKLNFAISLEFDTPKLIVGGGCHGGLMDLNQPFAGSMLLGLLGHLRFVLYQTHF